MRIIVPLDLSPVAEEAIEPAVTAAKALGDELLLVTVGGPRLRADLADLAEAEHAAIPDMIEAYLKGIIADLDGLPASHTLIPGDNAAEALVSFATGDDIRMIVMASHGRSGMSRWRLGSVAERVVRHSDVPVLVIPTRASG